jgi:putative transposase
MPRKARVLVPNCTHQIVQRGYNCKAIFLTDDDCQYYLSNLKDWKNELKIKIYGWRLMTNHIYIVAEPEGDPMVLSTMMKRVNGHHSAYINRLEGRSAGLWEGRYKASPIQADN